LLHRRAPRGALLVLGLSGVVLSLGPHLLVSGLSQPLPLPYVWLSAIIPGFSTMRQPQRFGGLATLAVMAPAALGLAELRSRLRTRGHGRVAAVLPWVLVAWFLVEATPRGLRAYPMQVGRAVPGAYRWLADHGDGGPLLELPASSWDLYRESLYMYF